MASIGRNESCSCGSGKKYKRCCLPKDEAAREMAARAEAARRAPPFGSALRASQLRHLCGIGPSFDGLDAWSNAVVDLVQAGELDEAEAAARDLLWRFPDAHDGYERLGMVYEARGDNKRAADCYRRVIAFVAEHPDGYDPDFADVFRGLVERLDPPEAT